MSENIGTLLAAGLVGALVVVAIVLTFLSSDPRIASDIFVPFFLGAVFIALGICFLNVVRS